MPPRKFTDTEKYCPECKQWKKHENFFKNRARAGGLSGFCKICHRASPYFSLARQRIYKRKSTYGVTPEMYQKMWDEQNGKCALFSCNNPIEHIDHDHITKKVRGLLCQKCNFALGLFRDDSQLMRDAAGYIDAHKDKQENVTVEGQECQTPILVPSLFNN